MDESFDWAQGHNVMAPEVSIVLPTHGRRASMLNVLRALSRQSVPAGTFEVVVVCDGDVDGSAEACRALAPTLPYRLRVLEQANQGPAAARNHGVEEAHGSLIIFLDDDVVPDERLIALHLEAHAQQETWVTIGPLLPPPGYRLSLWAAWEARSLCRQYADMEAGRWQATYHQFYTGNAAVLKRHIIAAGGFDPSFRRAEDVELALRLHDRGLHFVFLSQARGWHYVQRTFASWLRIPEAYGAADVAMARAGHPHVLEKIAREYPGRSRAVRTVASLCAGRPRTTRIVVMMFSALAHATTTAGAMHLGNMICSLIFNLRYYDSLAGALGGRPAFEELLRGQDVAVLLQRLSEH